MQLVPGTHRRRPLGARAGGWVGHATPEGSGAAALRAPESWPRRPGLVEAGRVHSPDRVSPPQGLQGCRNRGRARPSLGTERTALGPGVRLLPVAALLPWEALEQCSGSMVPTAQKEDPGGPALCASELVVGAMGRGPGHRVQESSSAKPPWPPAPAGLHLPLPGAPSIAAQWFQNGPCLLLEGQGRRGKC